MTDDLDQPTPEEYPLWCTGFVFRHVFQVFKISPIVLGALAFAGYWALPLLIAAFSGTLVSRNSLSELISNLPPFISNLGFHQRLLDSQELASGLAYLNDRTHFMFAAFLIPGGWVASKIMKKINYTVAALRRDGLPNADKDRAQQLYFQFRGYANHWAFRIASLFLAAVTLLIFLNFHINDAYISWWGHRSHGPGGLLFAGIEAGMVYFGTQTMVLTGFASVMFARLFGGQLKLRPFHPDGANGLAPMGRMVMLFWFLALAIGAEICVTLFLGYLGLEKMPLTWILALAGLIAIPALAIVPLAASLRAIHRARATEIGRFEPLLNALLTRAEAQTGEGSNKEAAETLAQLSDVCGVHEALVSLNVWPFNPKALTIVVAVYVFQVVVTLKEFLGL